MPLPKKTHTPQGTDENVHLNFLHVGQTSREEVREKLKAFDTGVQSERFFLGRWTSSTWAWFAGAQGGAVGGRHWSTTNLLIEFDENGMVKRFENFPDKDLQRKLGRVAEEHKHQDTAERVEVPAESAKIILSGGNLEFVGVGGYKRPANFTIGASKVSRIVSVGGAQVDPAYCVQMIQFTEVTEVLGAPYGPKWKKVHVRIRIPDLVTLMSYVYTNGGSYESLARH